MASKDTLYRYEFPAFVVIEGMATSHDAESAAESLCNEVNKGDSGRVFLAGLLPRITKED